MNPFPLPPKLDEHEIQKLNSLSEEDCVKAIQILKARLNLLRSEEFKLLQPVSKLNLSTRASNVLLNQNLYTIKDVLVFGLEKIRLLRNAGPRTVEEIKAAIERSNQVQPQT